MECGESSYEYEQLELAHPVPVVEPILPAFSGCGQMLK